MNIRSKFLAVAGASALAVAAFGTAFAGAPATYATVSGHEAFSEDANHEDYWGEDCTKLNANEGDLGAEVDSYLLTADYGKVIVKAGSGEFANTIFDSPNAGEWVWADTNGDGFFNPGGVGGDKSISHIIFCDEVSQPTDTLAPTFSGGGGGFTDAPSFSGGGGGLTDAPTEMNTATIGGKGTSGPADGAWLLVVALGVLLASIVVLTPARAKSRR